MTRLNDVAFNTDPHVDDCDCTVEAPDPRCVEYRGSLTPSLRPMFGAHALQPEGLRAVYGGRWIVQQDGYTDLVPGRHGTEGEDTDLLYWLNHGKALAEARQSASRLLKDGILDTRKRSPIVLFQDAKGVIVGDTNASAGYLYVTGWLFDDLPTESTTKGLDKLLDALHAALEAG